MTVSSEVARVLIRDGDAFRPDACWEAALVGHRRTVGLLALHEGGLELVTDEGRQTFSWQDVARIEAVAGEGRGSYLTLNDGARYGIWLRSAADRAEFHHMVPGHLLTQSEAHDQAPPAPANGRSNMWGCECGRTVPEDLASCPRCLTARPSGIASEESTQAQGSEASPITDSPVSLQIDRDLAELQRGIEERARLELAEAQRLVEEQRDRELLEAQRRVEEQLRQHLHELRRRFEQPALN